MSFPSFLIGLGGSMGCSIIVAKKLTQRANIGFRSTDPEFNMLGYYSSFIKEMDKQKDDFVHEFINTSARKQYTNLLQSASKGINDIFKKE